MRLFPLVSSLLLLAATVPAATIISVSDADPDDPGSFNIATNRPLAMSFTTPSQGFTNVTIEAAIAFPATSGSATIQAFLTRGLGAGTTVSDEVAATGSILAPMITPNTPAPLFTLFTGLALAPNTTYFISVFPVSGGGTASWDGESPALVNSDFGVTLNTPFFYAAPSIDGTYAPASTFALQTFGSGFFTITGDAVGGEVPEPSTVALVGLGLIGASVLRRRRS